MAPTPVVFSKLDDAASKLLKAEDFDLNKKVSITSKTDTGLTVTNSLTVKGDNCTVGNIKAEYKCKKTGEHTAEFDTCQLISGTWKTNEIVKGMKVELKAKHDHVPDKEDKTKKNLECFISSEDTYIRDNFAGTGLFKVTNSLKEGKNAEFIVGGSGVFGVKGVSIGGEIEYDMNKLTKSDVGAACAQGKATFAIKTAKAMSDVSFSYHHAVLPKTNVAAIAGYAIAKKEKSLKFGVSQEIDGSSSIKTAFVTTPKETTISALYTALLSPHAKLSLASVIDVKQFAGGNHKFGIKFEVGDL